MEDVRFVRVPDLPGVELMLARSFRHLWRTFRTAYELVLIEGGGAEWRLGSRRYRSGRGSVYLIAPGDFHVGVDVKEATNFASLLVPETFVVDDLGRPLRFLTNQIEDRRVTRAVALTMRTIASGAHASVVEAKLSELFALLAEVAGEAFVGPRARSGTDPVERRVERMRTWLHERVPTTPSLGELAGAVGVSRYRALREFKRQTGVTPFEYLMHVRLGRAVDLLRAGEPGADVAHEVGFADQSHLIRWFRRQMRVTPRRFVSG